MQPVRYWPNLVSIVNMWATQNAAEDYTYGSRQSYWLAALNNHVITIYEFEYARSKYGDLWSYRGD
jgi:hypothetical protein